MKVLKNFTLLIMLSACNAPQKVIQFVNQEADFTTYHTYSIINYKTGNKSKSNTSGTAYLAELENEIAQEMQIRAYTQDKNADLIVRYETATGIKTSNNAPNYYANPYYYDPYAVGQNRAQKSVEGLLLIEIKDKNKKLVWQGSVDMRFSRNPEENKSLLKKSIHRMFETYPYKAGSVEPFILKESN